MADLVFISGNLVRWVSADTLVCDVGESSNWLLVPIGREVCRVATWDAWETFGPNRLAGRAARAYMWSLFSEGEAVNLATVGRDQWGRLVGSGYVGFGAGSWAEVLEAAGIGHAQGVGERLDGGRGSGPLVVNEW